MVFIGWSSPVFGEREALEQSCRLRVRRNEFWSNTTIRSMRSGPSMVPTSYLEARSIPLGVVLAFDLEDGCEKLEAWSQYEIKAPGAAWGRPAQAVTGELVRSRVVAAVAGDLDEAALGAFDHAVGWTRTLTASVGSSGKRSRTRGTEASSCSSFFAVSPTGNGWPSSFRSVSSAHMPIRVPRLLVTTPYNSRRRKPRSLDRSG